MIRAPREEDAPGLARLLVTSWREAYTGLMPEALIAAVDYERRLAGFRRWLGEPPGQRGMLLAESAGGDGGPRIVAWAAHGPCRDEGAPPRAGELYALYVLRELWGTGLGRELLERSLADLAARELAPVSLWVLTGNLRACRFYEREGFRLEPGREREVKRVFDTPYELEHSRYLRSG